MADSFSGSDRSRNKFTRSEQSRICFEGLKLALKKVGSVEPRPTTCYSILTTIYICIFTVECRAINDSDVRFKQEALSCYL